MAKDKCLQLCLEWLLEEKCPDLTKHFGGYVKASLLVFLYSRGYKIKKDGIYNKKIGRIEIYRTKNSAYTHAVAFKNGETLNPYNLELTELVETVNLGKIKNGEEVEIMLTP